MTPLSSKYLFLTLVGGLFVAPTQSTSAESTAVGLLEKMFRSEPLLGYSGQFVYSNGQGLATMQIDRTVNGPMAGERLIASNGQILDNRSDGQSMYRVNPASRTILVSPRLTTEPRTPDIEDWNSLEALYQFRLGDLQWVAGQYCQQVSAIPQDHWRYGTLYCIEQNTGLVLRSSTVSETGDTVEQMVFTRIQLTDPGSMEPSLEELEAVGFKRVIGHQTLDLHGWAANWSLVDLPPGFVLRVEELRQEQESALPFLYLGLDDGLAGVSLFVRPLQGEGENGLYTSGAISTLQRPLDDYQLILVGEVPPATLERIANGFRLTRGSTHD